MALVVLRLKEKGFQVIGVPHQYYGVDQPLVDDRNIFLEISKIEKFDWIEDEWLDIDKYMEFYLSVSCLFGMRRHSFIFSACAGVPVVALSENPNASRAVEDIGGDVCLDFMSDPEVIADNVEQVYMDRFKISSKQCSVIDEISRSIVERYSKVLFK